MKSREHIVTNGKAAFYACIWPDLRDKALDCGWALGLHGSLSSDMDIMAMPWTEDAKPVEEMIKALSDCFTESPYKATAHYGKPNGRVVYTMSIWADFHLDINVIQPNEQLHAIMQAEGADVSDGAAVGSEGWEKSVSVDNCDHAETTLRMGIWQCAMCGKPK